MLNPLRPSHARLANEMLEQASKLPRGRRVALVMADGCAICFGNEKAGMAQTVVLVLQQRLSGRGIEPTTIALSKDGSQWVIIGTSPALGSRTRALEEELEQLLRSFRLKTPRRRRSAGKASGQKANRRGGAESNP
jgi:hypothetical protein